MANSMRSPKSRFYGEIVMNKTTKELGQVVSFSSDDILDLKKWLKDYAPGHVTIRENTAVYPEFNWQKVEEYDI